MTPFLQWETYAWADLIEIEFVPRWAELRLHLADGRYARVSIYFNGVDDFVEFAKAKLAENVGQLHRDYVSDGLGPDEQDYK